MDESSSAVSGSTATMNDPLKPLWKFVVRTGKSVQGGGNLPWECTFCKVQKKGSYTRVRAHLLAISGAGIKPCSKVTKKDIFEFKRLEEEAAERVKNASNYQVPLPPSSGSGSNVGACSIYMEENIKKRKGTNKLEEAFNNEEREQLDHEVARMFYTGGVPFNLARNPHYQNSYTFAANHKLGGYVPPGYNKLRTTLLQKEKRNVDRLLAPIRAMWAEKGISIVSDGWSDSQRRPLINIMAVSDGAPMFLRAIDCSGDYKDKHFIAGLLKDVIVEVGHEKVVQVVTDNAPVCKAAGQLLEQQFPSIVWTPCVVHTLNLALRNICAAKNADNNDITYMECVWITDVIGDVWLVKNFIMNHAMRLAMFNEFVNLKLLSVAETRFASAIVMLRRIKLIKGGLQAMVISDRWNLYRDDDVAKARFVKEKVLDDEWWDSIDYILAFTTPMYDMLRICDTDRPCLHLVYDMWDSMIEKVKKAIYEHEVKRPDEESTFFDVVQNILVDRWNKNNTPLHCLSHSLNPRYYTREWLDEDPSRVPPHKDNEINKERMKCLRRYFPNLEDRNKVNLEYAEFIGPNGDFREYDSISNRYGMDPKTWWLLYGASAPILQGIALKLLAQPSSSSCAERNWSTYSFIHSVRRNKMTPQRAEDLVFVHSNLRLLSRRTPKYSQGETKMWDVGGDNHDGFEDVGMLRFANLSLDEPEMEAEICREGNNDGDGGEENDEEDDTIDVD